MKAVLKYPGAKWRIADWIISYMPEHRSYLEPYAGSLAVFFNKQQSPIETINDIDGDVVNLFRCIHNDSKRLASLVAATPYSRAEYEESFYRQSYDDSLDWQSIPASQISKNVITKVKPGSIILFHNAAIHTPEALPGIIENLQKQGYKLVPISQLIYKDNYTMDVAGKQHSNMATSSGAISSAKPANFNDTLLPD
jgi:hypothetical protein